MNQKPASLPLNHRRVFRSGLCAALLLAATLASRAQPVPSPELQFTLSSSIAPVGQDWAIYADARIINPRFWNFMEPVVLSISSPLVTPTACGPLWFGWGSAGVTATPRGDTPGVYDVVARASTADWVEALFPAWPGPGHPLDGVLAPDERMETTITRQVTLVGLTGVTPAVTTGNSSSAYHVAEGDTVTFTASMTPVNAFDLVWWEWWPGNGWPATGQTYTKVMTRWPSPLVPVVEVTATCGNSVVTVPITVYQITGVSASRSLVAAGDPLSFTATIDPPGGSPPPIEWFVNGVWQGITATGATFSPANPAPGYYSVSAKMGGTEQYAGATVVGIGSVSMSGPDYNGPVLAGAVRYIYQNDSYTFTATAAPEGAAWPLNQPQWTINGTTTTGPDAPGTFGTLSTSISDFKTAVASCGTSSGTVIAVVYKCELTFAPDENFDGRSLSEFGIGETITVTNTMTPSDLAMDVVGLEWRTEFPYSATFTPSLPSGSGGVATTGSGGSAAAAVSATGTGTPPAGSVPVGTTTGSLSGVGDAGNFKLRMVQGRNGVFRAEITFAYILPTDVSYASLAVPYTDLGTGNVYGSSIWHLINTTTAGRYVKWFVHPEHVAWKNMKVREWEEPYQRQGYCAFFQNPVNHAKGDPHDVVRSGGKWQVVALDTCSYGSPDHHPYPDQGIVFSDVNFSRCPIPIYYLLKTDPGRGWRPFATANFSADVNNVGDVTVTKKNVTFGPVLFGSPSKDYNDP